MGKKVLACFVFVFFLCFALNAYAQTRTAWEQNNGDGLVIYNDLALSQGSEVEFDYVTIPPEDDPNWFIYTGLENINYSEIPSSLCDIIDCLAGGQFTFFRTYVDIPGDMVVTEFKITAEVVVDGIQVTILNSGGEYVDYISLGSGETKDFKDDVVPGEINTIVITHVDDCCCSNSFLNDVKIMLNGQVVNTCAPPVVVTRNITVMLDCNGNASITAADVDAGSTYDCGLDSMTVAPSTFSCNHLGQNTVTLTVTDVKGNSDSGTAIVTVVDNIAPTVTGCPADITVNNDSGECNAAVSWTPPTFADNCMVECVTSTHEPGDLFPAECAGSAVGTVVTYTAIDSSNNETTCSFTVTVLDNEAPVLSDCPADITVNNDPGACGAVVSWTPPTFTDNCNIASVTSPHNPGDFFSPAECADSAVGTVVTYTAVDDCGNTTTCSFTVTVLDNEAPVVSGCPADITVNNDPGVCGAAVDWTPPTFTDNCNVASVTSTHNPGDFFPAECADSAVGTVVTYTAVDDCGNTTTCSFTVIVLDMEAPVIAITSVDGNYEGLRLDGIYGFWDANAIAFWNTDDIVVSYDVTDNCDPNPVVTHIVEWEGEVQDGVGELDPVAKTITIDPYLLVGELKVTVTATDYCSNSASDSTEFTIILKVNKVIVKPERFCVNPGKFTVFAWFPDPYDITTISDAKADGAPLLKMNTCGRCLDLICDMCEEYVCNDCEDACNNNCECDDECDDDDDDEYDDDDCDECNCHYCDFCENWSVKAILKFNRNEIPESLVDRYFVLRGVFEYNGKDVYFQGSDEVKFECHKGGKPGKPKPPKFHWNQHKPWNSGYSFGSGYSHFYWLFQKTPRWGGFWNWNDLPLFYYDD